MNYELQILSVAEDNIENAALWYYLQAAYLETKFMAAIEETFNRILDNPFAYPRVHDKYRRALVGHFPYIIYFVLDKNIVKISTVFHTSRSPENIYKQLH